MKILFFGDIVGRIGRQALAKKLPELKKKHEPDLVMANAENLAHGVGITEKTITEMLDAGINFFTTGNHIWDNEQGLKYLENENIPVIRPANFLEEISGSGFGIVEINNYKILIINVAGQVFLKEEAASPFETVDEILRENASEKPNIVLVDLHAEATSEKQALWYYLDGRISVLLGTHTHVPTANPRISKKGTGLVEDVGMVGGSDSVIGANKDIILNRFLNNYTTSLEPPETGPVIINSVLLDIDPETGQTKKIERIDLEV